MVSYQTAVICGGWDCCFWFGDQWDGSRVFMFLLLLYLLRNFIFIGLVVVGTKFCLCLKVTDYCNRNCFYIGLLSFLSPHLLNHFKQLWSACGPRCKVLWRLGEKMSQTDLLPFQNLKPNCRRTQMIREQSRANSTGGVLPAFSQSSYTFYLLHASL